jgi:hypothetical protein
MSGTRVYIFYSSKLTEQITRGIITGIGKLGVDKIAKALDIQVKPSGAEGSSSSSGSDDTKPSSNGGSEPTNSGGNGSKIL